MSEIVRPVRMARCKRRKKFVYQVAPSSMAALHHPRGTAPPWKTALPRYSRSFPGLGSEFGHQDSGSTLHFLFKKFPEKTESSHFIDTRFIYRSAWNDDGRDDSL